MDPGVCPKPDRPMAAEASAPERLQNAPIRGPVTRVLRGSSGLHTFCQQDG